MSSFEFYRGVLGAARYVVAPMVDQSELAWRLVCKHFGAQLCFSPMLNANTFVNSYPNPDLWSTCHEEGPVIVQIASNNPDLFVRAAELVQHECAAIDLNLGCPQHIAKRGRYGAYLQDDWDTISSLISAGRRFLKVPVTCKIRVFEDVAKSIQYAQMIEASGCQLLTVHGRTREQKGVQVGVASWSTIRAIKESVRIPVVANGNITSLDDADDCLRVTKADAVMSAEGVLHNPALFSGKHIPLWEITPIYFKFIQTYGSGTSSVRSHLFRLYHASLEKHVDMRNLFGTLPTIDALMDCANRLNARLHQEAHLYHSGMLDNVLVQRDGLRSPQPYWIAQAFVPRNTVLVYPHRL